MGWENCEIDLGQEGGKKLEKNRDVLQELSPVLADPREEGKYHSRASISVMLQQLISLYLTLLCL